MREGEESNEESREAAEEEGGDEEPSEAPNAEENVCGASSDSQRPSEPSHSSECPLQLLIGFIAPHFAVA